jgi:molybdopterin converting factor small subunit
MTFRFSGMLLRYVDYRRTVPVAAATLGDALATLTSTFPAIRPVLQDNGGELRRTHRLFLNGELVPWPTPDMPLVAQDDVEFLTMIAGG